MSQQNGLGGPILLVLGVLALCGGAALIYQSRTSPDGLEARLVKTAESPKGWKVIDEPMTHSGATVPPDMNVVFRLPLDMEPTTREVLLGQKGKDTRYWGYCFGENFTEETVNDRVARGNLPGRIFLSEKEREMREEEYQAKLDRFTAMRPPKTKEELEAASAPNPSPIQHQIDTFLPGMVCYIMSEDPLALGVDDDNDLLNNKLEKEIGTSIDAPDTDQDGITDGVEVLNGTLPKVRDSDGDGLVDGLEDKNWNGRVEAGEPNPRSRDSDKDGLCDGLCRDRLPGGQVVFTGEDKNLNGQLDSGETDPLQWSTKRDGVSDYQKYIDCQLGKKSSCTQ